MNTKLFDPYDTDPATRFAGWLSQELIDNDQHLKE